MRRRCSRQVDNKALYSIVKSSGYSASVFQPLYLWFVLEVMKRLVFGGLEGLEDSKDKSPKP
jgi:hypothetical protein